MNKKIVFTGGGTAGHVTPNIALLPHLEREGYEAFYIGSYNGIEKRLIEDFNIPYYGISTGKFRRYFDLKNFSDPFRVINIRQPRGDIAKFQRTAARFHRGDCPLRHHAGGDAFIVMRPAAHHRKAVERNGTRF